MLLATNQCADEDEDVFGICGKVWEKKHEEQKMEQFQFVNTKLLTSVRINQSINLCRVNGCEQQRHGGRRNKNQGSLFLSVISIGRDR